MAKLTKSLATGVLILLAYEASAATKFHRVTWDRDPSSNAVIGFSPDGNSNNAYVHYGSSTDESSWQQKSVGATHVFDGGLTNHFVYLNNLPAHSPVFFRVCDQDGCGDRFWFRTAPDDQSPFVAIAGGDTRNGVLIEGNGVNFRDVGNTVLSQIRPLFVMHGGDYTNNNTDGELISYFNDWNLTYSNDVIDGLNYKRIYPVIPTHGNHENGGGDDNFNTLCQVFGVDPNRDGRCDGLDSYSAFNVSPLLRVYTLNTELTGDSGRMNVMNNWLKSDLESNLDSAVWRFVQYHRPMFPHTDSKSDSLNLYAYWSTMFYDNAVNLVVESDTHLNKITRPLVPSNNTYAASATGAGTVFTGEGSWGVPTRSADNPRPWTVDLASFQQFKVITVRESGIELRTAKYGNSSNHNDLNTGITPLTADQRNNNSTLLPNGVDWWQSTGLGLVAENGTNNSVYNIRQNNQKLSVIGSKVDNNLRQDIDASADVFIASGSTIFSSDDDRNFNGDSDGLLVDQTGSKGQTNTLIKWDLSAVPQCAAINSAAIRLNLYNGSTGEFTVHQSQRPWSETSVTWDNLPRGDARGAVLATFNPERNISTGTRSAFNIQLNQTGLDLVRLWQNGGTNNGVIIDQSSGINGMDFDSRETGSAPKLIVLYTTENCPASPDSYPVCANENATCTLSGTANVLYGAGNDYVVQQKTNAFLCSNSEFGTDPAPGIVKTCRIINYIEHYRCAGEGGVCTTYGLPVRYGANGQYVTNSSENATLACTNAAFGTDPAPGVAKQCDIQIRTNGQACANERGSCNLGEGTTRQVWYGSGNAYTVQQKTGAFACTNQSFGGDPAPGVAKSCRILIP